MSQRRSIGGARREASERVTLDHAGGQIEGWTLNVSRGGVRIVVEAHVQVGQIYDVVVGPEETARPGRVVWVRDEADGQIAGVQFLDGSGSVPPADVPDSTD